MAGPTIGGTSAKPAASTREDAPRLVIPIFENKTFEPNLEQKLTTYARHEFSAGSGVRVVPGAEAADLRLKATIVSVLTPSLSFTQSATFETRVTVTVKAVVEDLRSGKEVWNQNSTASSEFFITNDLQFNRVLQARALEQAGRLIAEDLATRFLAHLEAKAQAKDAAPAEKKSAQ
ncbi:MAG: LPS assembly lipoprotein LptE [Nitrospirota bacterium]